jgi:hypothetical protein
MMSPFASLSIRRFGALAALATLLSLAGGAAAQTA